MVSTNAFKTIVRLKFPASRDFDEFLENLVNMLSALRSTIYHIQVVELANSTSYWQELRLQLLFQLFLNHVFALWYMDSPSSSLVATNAKSDAIEFETGPEGARVKWKGFADVKCGVDGASFSKAVVTVEMKVVLGKGCSLFSCEATSHMAWFPSHKPPCI